MKHKTIITIIFGMILLIGVVAAAGTITNVNPLILDIPDFIAGGTTSTEFSFDYENDGFNNPDASLVLKVVIDSLEDICPLENCSVGKGDFQLNGLIEQYSLFGLFLGKSFPLTCVENDAEFRVQQGLLYTEENIPDGTFYCYDSNNYLDMLELDKRDKVILDISSDPALYPGPYQIAVELMEMEPDNQGPVIELIEPSGDNIFSQANQVIPIKLNITDMYNIDDSSVRYKIVSLGIPSDGEGIDVDYYDSGWIYDIEYDGEFYVAQFDMEEHGLTESGSYWIYAEAKDILGNEGKL